MKYISASRIKMISECKKQFYHNYIVGDIEIPDNPFSEFGTAMHETLEEFRKDSSLSRRDLVGIFCSKFKPPEEFKWMIKRGCSTIYKLSANRIFLGELVGLEIPFEVDIDGITLRGVIDKVEKVYTADKDGCKSGEKLIITDYKTNMSMKPEKYYPQLAVYDLAAEQLWPGSDREFELFYVCHGKSFPFSFRENFSDQTLTTVKNVVSYIKENQDDSTVWTKMKKKDSLCQYCPLYKTCWSTDR